MLSKQIVAKVCDLMLLVALVLGAQAFAPVAHALDEGGTVDFDPDYLSQSQDKAGRRKERQIYISVWYSTQTGRYGVASAATVKAAHEKAEKKCKSVSCTMLGYVKNQCIAVAAGSGKSYGYFFSTNKSVAENRALENCRLVDYDCRLFVSACAK